MRPRARIVALAVFALCGIVSVVQAQQIASASFDEATLRLTVYGSALASTTAAAVGVVGTTNAFAPAGVVSTSDTQVVLQLPVPFVRAQHRLVLLGRNGRPFAEFDLDLRSSVVVITGVSGTGSPGRLSKWSDHSTLSDSSISDVGTTVRVDAVLHVAGNAHVSGNLRVNPGSPDWAELGTNSVGVAARGTNHGVSAEGTIAVQGIGSHVGIQGSSEGSGPGVEGRSAAGTGVHGSTEVASAAGVAGINTAPEGGNGVYGESLPPEGWGTGVVGVSNGTGVYGESKRVGNSGVGVGVHGKSATALGVFGESTDWTGVYGQSTRGTAVHGRSSSHTGVAGESVSGTGVSGRSSTGLLVTSWGILRLLEMPQSQVGDPGQCFQTCVQSARSRKSTST
jgi:hypothetical protein